MAAPLHHVSWSRPAADRPGTLLVVALHGRGSDERSMAALREYLPAGVTVAAPRGPLALADGFTWFENRGIGRPIAESIADTVAVLLGWLDDVAGAHSGVVLLGFSGGTAMAGGLLLAEPDRFAAAVLLSGTLPWDAGFDTSDGRLSGLPVFWSIDVDDPMIPRDLVDRSESWLRSHSGADLGEHRYPGVGHALSIEELGDVRTFIAGLA